MNAQLNPEVFAKLEVTVRQFLDQKMPFSAYNITIATRDREKIRLMHRDLQGDGMTEGVIHTICHLRDAMDVGWTDPQGETTQWTRSEFQLNSTTWFWVYHPVGYDVTQYQPYSDQQLQAIWGQPAAPSPAASVNPPQPLPAGSPSSAVPIPARPDSGGQDPDDEDAYSVDYRKRLLIPTKFVREIGLKAGDSVQVIVDEPNKAIMLAADATNFQNSNLRITTQRIERDGDLRLSSATLSPLAGEKYLIENSNENQTPVVKVSVNQ